MTNIKKTADISIRLQKQVSLPKPQELIEMAHEARRAKKRIELPWHPEGRPEPALITVKFDETTNKSTWSIYKNNKSDAEVAWTEVDPDPTKIVLALRDWYSQARETEGWAKNAPSPTIFSEAASAPTAPPSPAPPPPTPAATYPAFPAGYQSQQPYPQQPGGVPVWVNTVPQPAYPYYPYANQSAPPAPPHWSQGAPPPMPGSGPAPTGEQPLPPELWALHNASAGASAHSPMLGDLLVAAGVIPTRTLQAALTVQNTGNMERRRIGEILVSSGALPNKVLDAAVKLQDMARAGHITNHRVTELLRQIHASGTSVDDLLQNVPLNTVTSEIIKPRGDRLLEEESRVSDEDREKLKQVMALLKDFTSTEASERAEAVLELFRKAAIVDEEAIKSAAKAAKDNPVDTVTALVVKEHVDPSTFEAALACHKLIKLERLKIEQAIIALGYCSRTRASLRDAISDLNWLIPMDGI